MLDQRVRVAGFVLQHRSMTGPPTQIISPARRGEASNEDDDKYRHYSHYGTPDRNEQSVAPYGRNMPSSPSESTHPRRVWSDRRWHCLARTLSCDP